MLKKKIALHKYALVISIINIILFNYPFFEFVSSHTDIKSSNGLLLLMSLIVLALFLNALVFYIGLYLLGKLGKLILLVFFLINSFALYFVNSYGVMLDRSMIGNILNTSYDESTSFFSFKLLLYVLFLGVLPSLFLIKTDYVRPKLGKFLKYLFSTLIGILLLAYVNGTNWTWIDKHSKSLGALVMPWSYVVNTCRYYHHQAQENKKQIPLPDAVAKDDIKSVFVLVIGESARSENFSLYGYDKDTNPLLGKMDDVFHYKSTSCATYTTAGVKCILEHENTSKLYEILPNYLHRNGFEVIWRTTNWGEPKVNIDTYLKKEAIAVDCQGEACDYDEVLLHGLKDQIAASTKDKIFVVLHTSTSHGPAYNKKYPPRFEKFAPVCQSVELALCSNDELMNAYDNTIVYTDYIVAELIEDLKEMPDYRTAMFFVSDHGESLGENNLYMHGLPKSISPKEQFDIPFIVWHDDDNLSLKAHEELSQHHVFHSVLDFLHIDSPIYNEEMSIFKEK